MIDAYRIKEITLLLGISVIIAFTTNHFSPAGIALFGDWDVAGVPTAKPKNGVVVHELEINDVGLAKKLYDTGEYLFIDARDQDSFEESHIKGAVSFPINEFDNLVERFLAEHPVSKPMITYCSGRYCEDSHELTQLLFDEGYTKIQVFTDGMPGWEAEGYPVE